MIMGIDVGGTFIKHALVSAQGTPIDEQRMPTPATPQGVIEAIVGCVAQHNNVLGLGVGMPGVVDAHGCVHHPPNIAGWTSVPLQAILSERLGIPVAVDNDANAAAMAEVRYGTPPSNTFVYITLGTGVGGTIIVNGKVFRGATGGAGEVGHVVVRYNDATTITGYSWRAGTVEEYVGVRALETAAGCSIQEIAAGVATGNSSMMAVVESAAHILAAGLASVMAVVGIPTLVVGGGVAAALPQLVDRCGILLLQRALPTLASNLVIAPATFGNHSGVIGAAALVLLETSP
jgi:glucokinase